MKLHINTKLLNKSFQNTYTNFDIISNLFYRFFREECEIKTLNELLPLLGILFENVVLYFNQLYFQSHFAIGHIYIYIYLSNYLQFTVSMIKIA